MCMCTYVPELQNMSMLPPLLQCMLPDQSRRPTSTRDPALIINTIASRCCCRHMAEVLLVDGHTDKSLAVLLFTNVQNSR